MNSGGMYVSSGGGGGTSGDLSLGGFGTMLGGVSERQHADKGYPGVGVGVGVGVGYLRMLRSLYLPASPTDEHGRSVSWLVGDRA